jgi:hypothetical protein
MGGTSTQTQTSQSQTTPYSGAQPGLNAALTGLGGLASSAGLNAAQSGAINQLMSNANAGNPYSGLIGSSATGLLNGGGAQNNDGAINANYKQYTAQTNPLASNTNYNPMSTPGFSDALNATNTDITNNINSAFAAAGRDGSPANTQALARGLAQGDAPMIASQYNQNVQNQQAAAGNLYGAGNTTYGLLNNNQQTANTNQQAGATQASTALQAQNYAPNAILNAQQQAFNIPAGNYSTILGALSPVAQAFGTQNGTQTGTSTMSGAQQFATIMGGFGSVMPKGPVTFGGLPTA